MPCFNPIRAIRRGDRSISFGLNDRKGDLESLTLPCGKCIGCRTERTRQWTVRLFSEVRCHDRSSFITLTYDDNSLPRTEDSYDLPTLRYSDVQGFLKRLRKSHSVRFFCAGEYGGVTSRPHYHLILFGVDFHEDRKPTVKRSDNQYYESDFLASLWPHGSADISDATRGSIAYCAGYITDKLQRTEEYGTRVPPFCRMSLRPGIGAFFFDRFRSDFRHGFAVIEGRKQRLPRYFRERMRKDSPELVEDLEYSALEHFRTLDPIDFSPERLRDREEVARSRSNFHSKRGL